MKAYKPPLSLWHLVEQHVPRHEHEEIKSMLGASLVEQSQELHQEIEMLIDIWREMRVESTESVSPQSTLPEPPDQRDRLVQEICFFVDNVKEKAKEKGIDPQLILKRHNSLVLNYAAEITRPESSQRASSSSDGRDTPLMSSSDNRENLSLAITDEFKAVSTKLNYLDFDEVCANLRSTLEREVDQLMTDIQFLQNCLDTEADFRDSPVSSLSREPTLSELREERSHLEKDLLATNVITTSPRISKPSFNLVPLSVAPDSSTSFLQTAKSSPLKADHCLMGTILSDNITYGRSTSILLNSQVKEGQLLKSSTQSQEKINSISKSSVDGDTSLDKNRKFSKSSSSQFRQSSQSFIQQTSPSSLPLPKKNDAVRNLGLLSGTNKSQNTEGYSQPCSTPVISVKKQNSSKVNMGVVRRTGSPGRVRVVELATVVGSQPKKDNNSISDLSSVSNSPSDISSSSTSPLLSVDSPMRPRSAHADRFRKMVLGCRDGD